jgi:hypothetical protein
MECDNIASSPLPVLADWPNRSVFPDPVKRVPDQRIKFPARAQRYALFGMGDKGLHAPIGGRDLDNSFVHAAGTIC